MKNEKKYNVLIVYLLSFLTFGIYYLFIRHNIAKYTNQICSGDGKKTSGLILQIILNILTFGIYEFIWSFSVAYRLANYHKHYSETDYGDWPIYILFLRLFWFAIISDYLLLKMFADAKSRWTSLNGVSVDTSK